MASLVLRSFHSGSVPTVSNAAHPLAERTGAVSSIQSRGLNRRLVFSPAKRRNLSILSCGKSSADSSPASKCNDGATFPNGSSTSIPSNPIDAAAPTPKQRSIDPLTDVSFGKSSPTSAAVSETRSEQRSLASLYLLAYNSVQAVGWAVALVRILSNFAATGSVAGAYASAGHLICLLQSIAFLEVVHGALGLVPSGIVYPFMQWGGRTHFLLAVVRRIVEVQELPAVFITFTAWSMIDAIRYPHYALNIIGSCPSWVVYIRYTAFIVLYPIGFLGELSLMCQSLPFVKMNNLYANFFAALPFSYYNFLWVVILSYPFLWLNLYLYMLKQRRSKLGNQNISEKKKLI